MIGSERHLHDSPELVSPELALVDPALAGRERSRLWLEDELGTESAVSASAPLARGPVIRRPPRTQRPPDAERMPRRRSWLVRGIAVSVLLFVSLGFAARALSPSDDPDSAQVPSDSAVPAVDNRVAAPEPRRQARPETATARPETTTARPETTTAPPNAPRSGPRKPSRSQSTAVTPTPQARTFAWAPVRNARGYSVEFFRGGRRIFVARTVKPRLTLPVRWTYRARRYRLTPGEYRWYVWPLARSRSGIERGKAIVQARLAISR